METLHLDRRNPALMDLAGGEEALPLTDEILAASKVWKLPEVRAWAEAVRTWGGGEFRAVARVEAVPCLSTYVPFRRGWRFWLGEEHPGLTVAWRRYEVDAWTGQLSLWDPRTDMWRMLATPISRAA